MPPAMLPTAGGLYDEVALTLVRADAAFLMLGGEYARKSSVFPIFYERFFAYCAQYVMPRFWVRGGIDVGAF